MRTIIVGGGAAGCFAAVQAARRGDEVCVIEKNPQIGRKLRITGKGRCNVTNNCDMDTLMQNIPRGGRFLYSAFAALSPQDVMAFFEDLGVTLKTERGNRVFPVSDQAAEVVEALRREMQRLGVEVVQGTVDHLTHDPDGRCSGAHCGDTVYDGDRVILATGGATYPLTGSEGDGYALVKALGHTVTDIRPSLVPLETLERDCAEMMGVSLKNVTLTLKRDGKSVYSELGEMLFTHFGVSGPLVLSASAHMDKPGTYTLHIDLKPALTPEQLDARIQREISAAPNKELPSLLRKLLPASMVMPMIGRCAINAHTKGNSLTKPQRQRIVQEFKDFAFSVRGTRPIAEGIITRGGVSLKEISPKTMESKLVPGLYIIGELLDCDAYTGGFNLQIAWSTAYAAAHAGES
jgi:hypothetical protein